MLVISEVSPEASSSQRVELSGLNDLLERARAAEAALILGPWQTTVSFEDGEIQVLFTFMPGRTPLEGALIDTNSGELLSSRVAVHCESSSLKKATARSSPD